MTSELTRQLQRPLVELFTQHRLVRDDEIALPTLIISKRAGDGRSRDMHLELWSRFRRGGRDSAPQPFRPLEIHDLAWCSH